MTCSPSWWQPMPATWAMLSRCSIALVLIAVSTMLQGCMFGQAFAHPTPSWMDVPNYWTKFHYIPQGDPAKKAVHNSCEIEGLPKQDQYLSKQEQCSGNGECKPWKPNALLNSGKPIKFCQCFRDWADPECRTKRKSQRIAYFLSIFGGYLGIDRFYLGLFYSGFAKCATLGLFGFWWVYDVVRIGSSPVYASDFRVAYDLPHWLFVAFTVLFFSLLGYFLAGGVAVVMKREKLRSKLLKQADEEYFHTRGAAAHINPEDTVGQPSLASYGVPLPAQYDNFGGRYGTLRASEQVEASGDSNPYSPHGIWKQAMRGYRQPQYDARGNLTLFA